MKHNALSRIIAFLTSCVMLVGCTGCTLNKVNDNAAVDKNSTIGYRSLKKLPALVQSKEDFADTKRQYVLPDGTLWTYTTVTKIIRDCTNLIPLSTDENSNVVGLRENSRYNSADTLVAHEGSAATGFIPVKAGDTVRFHGVKFRNKEFDKEGSGAIYMRFYDSSFSTVYQFSAYTMEDAMDGVFSSYTLTDNGEFSSFVLDSNRDYAYMRITFIPEEDITPIITVNEEIFEDCTPYDEWQSKRYLTKDWYDEITAASNKVKALNDKLGDSAAQFLFVSDIHYEPSRVNYDRIKNIGKVAAGAMQLCDIPFFMVTGDNTTQSSGYSTSDLSENMKSMLDVLSPVPTDNILLTVGNHDGATGKTEKDGVKTHYCYQLDNHQRADIYFEWQKSNTYKNFGRDGTYYYIDDAYTKTRYIMLNTFYSQFEGGEDGLVSDLEHSFFHHPNIGADQYDWLCKKALDMPEGYAAVIGTHNAFSPADRSVLNSIISAYTEKKLCEVSYTGAQKWQNVNINEDFSESKGEIIAIFQGHDHRDAVNTTTYPVPCITITTAGADIRDENSEERIPGTTTETALDIVTIDRENRKIYLTRLGVGEDRVVEY